MQPSARENYLTTEVMTATPQKLHLTLIQAAIRCTERAREKWRGGEDRQAAEALIRAQEVVGELLACLNREVDANLVKKVAAVYLFVFRSLMEASRDRDEKKLDGVLRVLEIERGTWRQVCEQLGGSKAPDGQAATLTLSGQPAARPPAAADGAPLPHVSPGSGRFDSSASSGISLEA